MIGVPTGTDPAMFKPVELRDDDVISCTFLVPLPVVTFRFRIVNSNVQHTNLPRVYRVKRGRGQRRNRR